MTVVDSRLPQAHFTFLIRLVRLVATMGVVLGLASSAFAQAVPQATVSGLDANPLIGAPLTFTVSFDNASRGPDRIRPVHRPDPAGHGGGRGGRGRRRRHHVRLGHLPRPGR